METAEDLDKDSGGIEHDAFGGDVPPPTSEPHDVDWTPKQPRQNPSWYWVAVGVVAIALGTGAFLGMRAAANKTSTTAANAFPGQGQGGQGGQGGPPGFQQGNGAFGLLQSVDGSTLTLETPDGQTVKVTTTSSTQITKVTNGSAQTVSLSQLTTGQPVFAQGTTGSDGTVAATAIRQGGGPRGFGPPPAQQGGTTQ